MTLDLLAILASTVFLIRLMPQPARLARHGVADGVSPLAAMNAAIGAGAWLGYGLLRGLPAVWIVSLLALVPGLWTVALLRRHVVGRDLAWAGLWLAVLVAAGGGGLLAAALGLGVVVTQGPQVVRAFRTRDLGGLSPATWWISILDATTWGAYGLALGDAALMGYGIVLHDRRRPRARPHPLGAVDLDPGRRPIVTEPGRRHRSEPRRRTPDGTRRAVASADAADGPAAAAAEPAGVDDRADLAERMRQATELLEAIARDRDALAVLSDDERIRLLNAAGTVFAPDVEERRQRVKARRRQERAAKLKRDEDVLTQTGIRTLRSKPVFTSPNVFPPEDFEQADVDDPGFRDATEEQHCYVCKQPYVEIHHFYDQLCPSCAEFNYAKRAETADLRGRVALLTGGRVKIGYQAGIKLLRAGAHLIVTTRFPRDAAARYAAEPDFDGWGERLEVYGLDLRHTPSVEGLCHHIDTTHARLDFIVNNACQTVRRPPEFYRHMMELETASLRTMPEPVRALLGEYEGLRGYDLLNDEPAALATDLRSTGCPGSPGRPSCRRCRCCPATRLPAATCSPKGGSTRTSSRSTCAAATRGD